MEMEYFFFILFGFAFAIYQFTFGLFFFFARHLHEILFFCQMKIETFIFRLDSNSL